jgi:predicted porin
LSKRTDLYVSAAYATSKQGRLIAISRDDPGFSDTQRGIVAGIQHRF